MWYAPFVLVADLRGETWAFGLAMRARGSGFGPWRPADWLRLYPAGRWCKQSVRQHGTMQGVEEGDAVRECVGALWL